MTFIHDGWIEADVEAAIVNGDLSELRLVPIIVTMSSPSRIWSERICVRLSTHPDEFVRGNAMTGFGHLARLYRYLNRSVVQPIILQGLSDPELTVRQNADSASDDVEWYLGWILPGREDRRFQPVCPR